MMTGSTSSPAGLDVRQIAVDTFVRVLGEHRTVEDVLVAEKRMAVLENRDRGFLFALLLAAFRHLGEIDAVLGSHLAKPLPRKAGPAHAILRLAVAQLLFLDTPPHAVIDLAVRSAKSDRNAMHFSGLINAVLRKVAAAGKQSLADLDSARLNTPDWLWSRWCDAYGEAAARELVAIHQEEPPLDLTPRSGSGDWSQVLGAELLPTGSLRLAGAHAPVSELPGFREGAWWVQDAAAAIPALLLGSVQDKSVLDLCAAPGGKTLQLCSGGGSVTAVDVSADRLTRLQENLTRCGLQAKVVAVDILQFVPDESFDAVLLDAPCSATGTIRRHPELPYIKSASQIGELRGLQRKLLNRAASFVRVGGTLVYCTCSLEPEEGEAQVKHFLKTHPDFSVDVPPRDLLPAEYVSAEGWVRILPHFTLGTARGLDGFFAVALTRVA